MPSFKERFRPSRKYKKGKEASGTLSASTDDSASATPTNIAIASSIAGVLSPVLATVASASLSTMAATTTCTTTDEHADLVVFSTHHSHYPSDQCECEMRECDTPIHRRRKGDQRRALTELDEKCIAVEFLRGACSCHRPSVRVVCSLEDF